MTSHLVSALLVVIRLRAACKLYISLLVTESFIKSYFSCSLNQRGYVKMMF